MLLDQRRRQLLELVRARGFASLPELAGELQVSESTVRRDLERLEDSGCAKRTHGGVVYTGESPEFPHFKDRQESQWDKKRAIAGAAAALIEDGETLLLDGGTTTYEVARLLVGRPLQIVTNSMPVANLFASSSDSDLVLIGGNVHLRTGVTLGPYANAMLSDLNVRRALMSVAAVNERGYYNSNILQVEIQRAMLQAGDEVIVVADSTKFGHSSLSRLCPLAEVDRLVVDSEIERKWRDMVTGAGTQLTIAAAGEPAE
ncbi:MAG: DeoR family transcriptional regulator [Planctomycetales bacterium]|nr:DeoR family transcriptional regulator [Planctomycetales bacterium]NIM09836.1 DeoR family transcriptional regulator [Planctomycetales bacterium]NIN09680.1 DeoR family transcriptional regulator [Planctomycetales bacterium]NIN78795.1 DeoR family transcriptional regulator [Planctomycetales bacterium]NIO35971.1 DeoR family transcriptional regulator [Planctomycetales bacterium]